MKRVLPGAVAILAASAGALVSPTRVRTHAAI